MLVPKSLSIHNNLLNYVKKLIEAWFSGKYQIDEVNCAVTEDHCACRILLRLLVR